MAEAREYISLSEAAIYSGCYSQEYLSLRARHGKLKAVKFGRNWVITKEWLDEYLERVNNYKNNQKKKERGRLIDRYLLPVRKLRLITITYVLVFLLLSAGIVFGYPYLEPALNSVSGFIEDTSSQLAVDIWDFSNLTRGVEGVGEFSQNIFVGSKKGIESFSGNLKFGLAFLREEVDKDLVSPFKNFFSFFRSKFQPEMTFGEEYVKNDIQNLKNFFRKIGGAIAYPFVKTYQFVVRPWSEKIDEEKIIEEIIKQRPEITTEEIENLRAQIEKLKEEGIVAKEIVKEVIKITQIEPVKEITREITKIDDEELKKLKSQIAGIQKWETDIKTLQVLTSKLQTHPPQTQVITAPVYIGSQGLQVGGVGIFSSLGVSGSAGITNLGVGGSTSLGSDSSDKLTVQATSEFFSPVTIQNTFTVGDATNYLIINSTGNLTTTGTLSAEGDVTISGASSLATTTITGDLIVNTNQLYVDTATGYVGIGTTSPATDLHILGSGTQLRIATSTSQYADFTIDSTGNLTIAPTGGILSLNTSSVQNKLMVYSTSTDYIEMYHSGTNAIIFANTGDIEIGATGTDVIIGDFGNAANLVFEEDSSISGQGQNTIYLGIPDDTFKLDVSNVTYDYGNVIPSASSTYNLGSAIYKWANLYAATTTIGDLVFSNEFRITEATSSPNSIIFLNQNEERIAELDETGNLWIKKLTIEESSEGQIVNLSSEALKISLASLGLIVSENGTLETKKIKTQELEVGSQPTPTGITIYDENTGQPYCIKIKAGEMVSMPGKCDAVQSDAVTPSGGGADCTPVYYYYDGDGDGYGYTQGSFQITCVQPEGHVPNNDDCNDDDPNINPGTTEICDDKIDNDCDGIIDNPALCQTEATTTTPTTTPEITCTPDWQCDDWQGLAETFACGEVFTQTRTCTDINECGTDENKPSETQEAIGTDCTICGITSCDSNLNLTGECQNTCVDSVCQTCVPTTCTCAEGFYDCDNDGTGTDANGCETQEECPVPEPEPEPAPEPEPTPEE